MNRKENYRDMDLYRTTRNRQRKRYYNKTSFKYPTRRWIEEEDILVLEHKITDTELSALIERSVASIQNRRVRLKVKGYIA